MPDTDNIQVRRNRELCVTPSSSRSSDFDFKRKSAEYYLLDHANSAQVGPYDVAHGTPVTVPLQGLTTARLLYLESNGAIDLYINGSATPLPLRVPSVPAGATPVLARAEIDTEITSIRIENPNAGSAAPRVVGYMIGD